MTYSALEKQINALPLEAQQEVAHYVGYLLSLYNKKKTESSITEQINAFMTKNPDAFEEFEPVRNVGIESTRELTKNDSW